MVLTIRNSALVDPDYWCAMTDNGDHCRFTDFRSRCHLTTIWIEKGYLLDSNQTSQNGDASCVMRHWQMQEAKARLSEVVKDAEREGPQEITLHGRPVAVVLSREQYDRLAGIGASLVGFMRRSPLYGDEEIDLWRDQSLTRDIPL
jgi:prevent-host-death family protein